MHYLIAILLLFGSSLTFSQNHHWGITFGGTLGWTEHKGYQTYDAVNGLTVDGYYTYRKGHFISKCALAFQQNGNKRELHYYDTLGTYLSPTIEKRRFSYMAINELVGLEVGKTIKAYIAAGLNFGVYLSTQISAGDVSAHGQMIKGYVYNERNLTPLDLSATIEGAIGVELFNEDYLFVISNYNHGLINVSYTDSPYEPSWNNNFMTIRLGVRHYIPEKKEKRKTKEAKEPSSFDSQ